MQPAKRKIINSGGRKSRLKILSPNLIGDRFRLPFTYYQVETHPWKGGGWLNITEDNVVEEIRKRNEKAIRYMIDHYGGVW